jgi:hypothetical protein
VTENHGVGGSIPPLGTIGRGSVPVFLENGALCAALTHPVEGTFEGTAKMTDLVVPQKGGP